MLRFLQKESVLKPLKNYTSEDLNPPPVGGAPFKYVTGNLVEELSAMRI